MIMQSKQFNLEDYLRAVEYCIAQTPEDKEKVYETVYKAYVNSGYICQENHRKELFPYHTQPHCKSFYSLYQGKIITTATLIPDSAQGLPMDNLFKEELDTLRKNKNICEISMLASTVDRYDKDTSLKSNASKMHVILHLFRHILHYIKKHVASDYICISINPKHRRAYESLFFRELGVEKFHTKLNQAPAIAKFVNVHTVSENMKKAYGIAF